MAVGLAILLKTSGKTHSVTMAVTPSSDPKRKGDSLVERIRRDRSTVQRSLGRLTDERIFDRERTVRRSGRGVHSVFAWTEPTGAPMPLFDSAEKAASTHSAAPENGRTDARNSRTDARRDSESLFSTTESKNPGKSVSETRAREAPPVFEKGGKTKIADDWRPSSATEALAIDRLGIPRDELEREIMRFIGWHQKHNKLADNWDGAFRAWLADSRYQRTGSKNGDGLHIAGSAGAAINAGSNFAGESGRGAGSDMDVAARVVLRARESGLL